MNYLSDEQSEQLEKTLRARELTAQGIRFIRDRDYNSALTTFNEALQLNPIHIPTLQYRGICKCMVNDITGAVDDFFKVLEQFEQSRGRRATLLQETNK